MEPYGLMMLPRLPTLRRCAPFCGLALFVLGAGGAAAQPAGRDLELGRPQIRNWTMSDYQSFPQTWVARRDADGRVYFGNRDGILMFDGQAWRILAVPGGLFVRGLEFTPDGRLYVAAVNQLGYFERNAFGEWGAFVSMVDRLPAEERKFGELSDVHVLPDGVFFTGNRRLFRWRAGGFKLWNFDGDTNLFSYQVGDQLYLHRVGDPLRKVEGDEIVVAADLPEIRAARLTAVLPAPAGLLLAWRHGFAELRDGRLAPWAEASNPVLKAHVLVRARRLGENLVFAMTERDGVIMLDGAGNFLRRIDPAAGLYNPVVRDVLLDAEGGLWFAMNHGVAHVDALAGITLFDGLNGLGRSTVRIVTRHGGALHAASTEGVFRLRPGEETTMARFERVPGGEGDVQGLFSHPTGLMVGMRNSVVLLPDDGGPRRVLVEGLGGPVFSRDGRTDSLWLATTSGVRPLELTGDRWVLGPRIAPETEEPRILAQLGDGSLWAATMTSGLWRWESPEQRPGEQFFETAGLPVGHGWLRIDRWRDELLVSSRAGIFRWEPAARRFSPFVLRNAEPGSNSMNIYGGDPAHVWSFFGRDRRSARIVRIAPDGVMTPLPQQIVRMVGDVETMVRENRDGREVLWVGGSYGLARVVIGEALAPRGEFRTVFGPIDRVQEPAVRGGDFLWPHGKADLTVRFAATTFRSGPNLQFQTILEGYDANWGAWSGDVSREFTNLGAGSYALRVRSRDADGRLGREARLGFVVTPPWWQTPWAYLGYVAGAGLSAWGLLRWRVRAAERERERLQQLVTERTCQLVESQQSLQQAKEAAETANRAKSAFLASMSHELRTPLNSVLGYAQILRRSPEVGPTARRALETIQRSGDHLLHLINEVLDLAKVESGRIDLYEMPFATERFVASLQDLFAVRATEKGITFSGPDAAALPAAVRGDEGRLRQVLVNLLGNAFKFTERGGRVTWGFAPGATPGSWRLEVTDTGVGIAAEECARIFEPFYQSAARPALAQQGTGLGLSISARLVQLMGGRLAVESEPGRGSRFWFEVALPEVALPAAAGPAPADETAPIVGYRGRPRRLLVVDDERGNRAVLEEMLTPLGFLIEEADSAPPAREAVRRQAPDAVLLDLRMPGDDGFTLAREWRANGTLLGAKVLALSASVLPEQQAEAIAAGCDAFLAKPFREEVLLRVIGSLLELEWVRSDVPQTDAPGVAVDAEVRWDAGVLRRLLQLAERGDALRLGQELADLARRGAAWAAAVAPWQKLALGYQMEALSRAIGESLQRLGPTEHP